jgi:hypothetical protein
MDSRPTEFVDGRWHFPTHDSVPEAVVAYATEPSPETGHVGWCWWALGDMGEAPTYESACAAAVASLANRACGQWAPPTPGKDG